MKYDVSPHNPLKGILLDDEGYTICRVEVPGPSAGGAEAVLKQLVDTQRCLTEAIKVIEDFLPNISKCVLQDYGRLNGVLCDSRRLLK